MKKLMSIIVGVILVVGLMAGCEDNVPRTQTNTQPDSMAANDSQNVQVPPTDNSAGSVDTSEFIGEEKAKEIALQKAGITSEGVIFDRVELDRDNGIWQYEVEFRKDRTEYDADIKADDGTIISWDVDIDD